ncbi:MAG TPA: hypothetical protein EYO02_02645 [Rhodospirillales bacterium]|nr:hypothetical protein [Rhodospirillales bacterium]
MILWVEANQQIGMGHLAESLAVAQEASQRGMEVRFLVTPFDAAEEHLGIHGMQYVTAPLVNGIETLEDYNRDELLDLVIVDHRSVHLSHLIRLHERGWRVAVIDQLGNKPMVCDLLINASMVKDWHVYEFPLEESECRFGPEFALLRSEFSGLNRQEKKFNGPPFKILVTMGGVDRTGATFNIIDALAGLGIASHKEIITGSGFAHSERLKRVKRQTDNSFSYSADIRNIGERLFGAHLAISAGGNTLYECACTGTPTIVLWEDDHERREAADFAREGAVINLGPGTSTTSSDIRNVVTSLLKNETERMRMSQRGMTIVDGRGTSRICDDLLDLGGI